MRLWDWLARLPLWARFFAKALLFGVVVLLVLYPCPHFLFRQVDHLTHIESLIQPDMAAMPEINRAIDAQLAPEHTPTEEYKAVERYVYQTIKYQYDWFNWGNIDYWPTATEVWERKREDCDGRAVLAASILRARGFKSARIVANLNHVWVAVDNAELMGPQADKNLRKVNGKTVITLPALATQLDALSQINRFPAIRCLLILVAALVLAYHPCRRLTPLMGLGLVSLVGFSLLLDWSVRYGTRESTGVSLLLLVALGLIVGPVLAALGVERFYRRKETKVVSPASEAVVTLPTMESVEVNTPGVEESPATVMTMRK